MGYTQGLVRNTIWPKPGFHQSQHWRLVKVPVGNPLTCGYGPWWLRPRRER